MKGIPSIQSIPDPWLAEKATSAGRNNATRDKATEATEEAPIPTEKPSQRKQASAMAQAGSQRELLGVVNARMAVSADGDTLEISRTSMEQAGMAGLSGDMAGMAGGSAPSGAAPSGAASTGDVQVTSMEKEEEEITNLSSYSERQLAQLLADGRISSAQYIAELKRREMADAAETETAESESTGTESIGTDATGTTAIGADAAGLVQ